jgi:hypothetical protein
MILYGTMEIVHAIIPAFDYFHLHQTTSQQALDDLSHYIK